MKIVLHIDRLVLRGVQRHDAGALTTALRSALQQQLAAPAQATALAAQASTPLLRTGTLALTPGAGAGTQGHAIGQAIAHQLHQGGPR